jgi:hypothetical protein
LPPSILEIAPIVSGILRLVGQVVSAASKRFFIQTVLGACQSTVSIQVTVAVVNDVRVLALQTFLELNRKPLVVDPFVELVVHVLILRVPLISAPQRMGTLKVDMNGFFLPHLEVQEVVPNCRLINWSLKSGMKLCAEKVVIPLGNVR